MTVGTCFKILKNCCLADNIVEMVIEAPLIARKAKPGNFVLVRADEKSERIPLTIADSDAEKRTVTLVIQKIGKSTHKICALGNNSTLLDVVGPLGKDREIHESGKLIACVSGGLGVAPMYPQTKAYFKAGNRVISIIGARNKDLLFWQQQMEAVSHETYYSTDDGSFGHHGFATQILERLILEGNKFDEVVAIGPVPHMKAVANVCKKYDIPVVVSLNPVMVDGTGMCGGCRVTVGGDVKYACVDGPEFDGALVDFDELMMRQRTYTLMEKKSFDNYKKELEGGEHECQLQNVK